MARRCGEGNLLKIDKLVGQAFSYMENKLFAAMDTLQFTNFNGTSGTLKDGLDKTKVITQSQVLGEVDRVINQAIQEFKDELPTELTGIPLADDAFLSLVITEGEKVANEFREEVKQTISDNYLLEDSFNNVTEIICNEINKLEVSLLAKINDAKAYVRLSGTVKMDALFFDMAFFKNAYSTIDDDIDTTISKYGTIKYTGLSGY